jgi:hypothetical protein
MYKRAFYPERGQGIVVIALILVALLAITALAIDGGLTYAQRRRAQNAADAGALAGARVMCSAGGGDPVAAARDYASRNGIQDVNTNVQVTASQSGLVSSVLVNVTLPYDTFLAGILGIANAEVGAVAEAACYPMCSTNTVLPIAWSCDLPDMGGTPISGDCNVFPQQGSDCRFGEDPIYIIVDTLTIEEDINCEDSGVDCDFNDDGINDVTALSGANRAWLDLNGQDSEGGDDLKDWVEGIDVPRTRIHTWYSGDTGAKDSVYQTIEDFRLDPNTVLIPVFDDFAPDLKNGDLPPPAQWHDGIDVFRDDGAGDYFHVFAFVGFKITCVSTGSNDHCPAKDAMLANNSNPNLRANTKTVEGCFIQIIGDGEGQPGECNYDTGAYTLKLIR